MLLLHVLIGVVLAELKFDQEITKLEQTQLGKTFLDTVQIAVKSKEPLDRVFQILRDQQQSYENEFFSIDEKHKSYSGKCVKDLGEFDNFIALLKARIMDLQQALDDKIPEKAKKVSTMQSKKKEKGMLVNRIDEIQQNRQKQKCMFDTRLEEHQTAISAVVAVREIFESALLESEDGQSSFIELQDDDIDKVQSLIGYASMKAGDFKHLQGYSSLFSVMEQLQVGQIAKHEEAVRKLVESCNDLENYIDIARSLLRSVDDIRESYFQRLFKSLNQDLRDVNAIIDELESDANVLEAQIKVLTMDRDEALQKQEAKVKQRGDRATECEQEESVYQFKLQENQRERETIQRILALCLDNVKELKQYIKKRGDQFY